MLLPTSPAPALSCQTVQHGPFDLAGNAPNNGTLVVFYRGLHCPICRNELKDLEAHASAFADKNVRVVAISSDTSEKAHRLVEDLGIEKLTVGYGLDMKSARDDWGLFISTAREGTEEPPLFSEPGHFWVRRDGTVSFSVIHSLPFMRPSVEQLLKAIDFTLSKGFPPRGSYAGELV